MTTLSRVKRVLFGRPIASKHAHRERLKKRFALPVFASDALSSTAYATEEIMRVFLLVGPLWGYAFFHLTVDIAILISLLIAIVSISYWQTIHAYPQGGGSYTVAKVNLGQFPGEVAGASLLIDYILTVAVSVSAGVLAIISFVPALAPHIVYLGVAFIGLLTIANLRGARESGVLFSVPTYAYILLLGTMIAVGLFVPGKPLPPVMVDAAAQIPQQYETLTLAYLLLVFKAFSSGCTALTGIEAISNGTQAFEEPVAKNAGTTLVVMSVILAVLFVGVSFLGEKFHVIPMEIGDEGFKTVLALISESVFPTESAIGQGFFWAMQIATAGILILAANTAYADFPRLAGLIARDGYLPRQMMNLGDRLVFQNGILVLALVASFLIVKFGGDTHKLIPLYAVGVFLGFTLSQFGMVVHSRREKKSFPTVAVSAVGGTITGIVTFVILQSKWAEGAWIVPIAMALVLFVMTGIKRHYRYLARELEVTAEDNIPKLKTTAILLVPRLHKGILQAIAYSESLTKDVRAIHVTLDQASAQRVKQDWIRFGSDLPLVILESPYRSLVDPIVEYIDQTIEEDPDMFITVIVPEAVPRRIWHRFLHNNVAISLKLALGSRRQVVVTNVRYLLK